MKNTFSVLFYVKKQQKKSGLLPIMGRITVNKQTTQFFTQLEIDPQTTEWDSKTKKINGKGASSLNSQLRNIEARIRTTMGRQTKSTKRIAGKAVQHTENQ